METEIHTLTKTFAVLKPDLSVQKLDVTPGLYQRLDSEFNHFRDHVLVSIHEFSSDWPGWERHPAGNEIVILLSGSATMVIALESGEQSSELNEAGSFIVVPRGAWHTAKISEGARMLFIMPGEGTENRTQP